MEAFSLWVLPPDIYPTIVIFLNDKLPDEIILPPVAVAPSLNMA
jgi:hypothetical protein